MKISTFFFGTAIIVFSSFIASCGDSEATMAMRAKQIAEDSIAKAAAALAQAKADSAAKAEAAITELVPETISVTEVTSTKSSKEEFNNEGLAEVKASFGIHIIAAGKAYDVQVENEDMNHEGGSIEKYEDMDKPIAETHKLRADILSKNVTNFILSINGKNEVKSFIMKEEMSGEAGKVGTYKPAVVIWKAR